jgi:phage regulator Rha-like protein
MPQKEGIIPSELIASKIYIIRKLKVMLDRDMAELYGIETKQLKRAVKRNLDRFPSDFMFELALEEYEALRCQIGTLKRGSHSKYPPFAFTEQGVAMLSNVLNSRRGMRVKSQNNKCFPHFNSAGPF